MLLCFYRKCLVIQIKLNLSIEKYWIHYLMLPCVFRSFFLFSTSSTFMCLWKFLSISIFFKVCVPACQCYLQSKVVFPTNFSLGGSCVYLPMCICLCYTRYCSVNFEFMIKHHTFLIASSILYSFQCISCLTWNYKCFSCLEIQLKLDF